MSDNSRSRVTVTLGRSGRVVKRAGGVLQDGFSNGVSVAGSKRSLRDRLGGDLDDRSQHYDKRQRGDSYGSSSVNDVRLGKNDLRFKLMEKSMVSQSRNNDSRANVDLRDKLSSRSSRPSIDSKTVRPPEGSVSARRPMHEPVDAGMSRNRVLDPRDPALLGRTPSSRTTHHLSTMDPGRSYSSWTLDNLRRRSPERSFRPSASRGFSPERSREDLQGRSLIRAYGEGRPSSSMRMSPPRHPSSSSYLTRSALPAPPVKPVAPIPPRYPSASGIMPKIPSMGDEPPTVESLLHSLGLDKYAIYFKAEEVDMNALRQMGDNDLKELGIPMGPRKKIIQAVMPRPRRQP